MINIDFVELKEIYKFYIYHFSIISSFLFQKSKIRNFICQNMVIFVNFGHFLKKLEEQKNWQYLSKNHKITCIWKLNQRILIF